MTGKAVAGAFYADPNKERAEIKLRSMILLSVSKGHQTP